MIFIIMDLKINNLISFKWSFDKENKTLNIADNRLVSRMQKVKFIEENIEEKSFCLVHEFN